MILNTMFFNVKQKIKKIFIFSSFISAKFIHSLKLQCLMPKKFTANYFLFVNFNLKMEVN